MKKMGLIEKVGVQQSQKKRVSSSSSSSKTKTEGTDSTSEAEATEPVTSSEASGDEEGPKKKKIRKGKKSMQVGTFVKINLLEVAVSLADVPF